MAEPYVPKSGESVVVIDRFINHTRPYPGDTVVVVRARLQRYERGDFLQCRFEGFDRNDEKCCLVVPAGGAEEAAWRLR